MKSHRLCFYDWYVSCKELGLPMNVKKALNLTYFLFKMKKMDFPLALTIAANKHSLEKQRLYKYYKERQSHYAAAKRVFIKKNLDAIEYKEISDQKKFCECGCGELVTKKNNKFIIGHNARKRTLEQKEYFANRMRQAKNEKKQILELLKSDCFIDQTSIDNIYKNAEIIKT